ncbi:odorant receptor 67a-like [Photinus pyralis]|uniref:odorant receptor 67a-like n=1 Tax=Photinus pyralis TaxID=7054 RepID=UPI0012677436|nr:odorant receptor 67a-like [Photinus pyralis]
MHSIVTNFRNFDLVINGLFNFIGGVSATLKTFVMLRRRDLFAKILKTIETLQVKRNTYEPTQNYVFNVNKVWIIVAASYYAVEFLLFIVAMYGRITHPSYSWRTRILDVTIVNITYSPNYELAYIYQLASVYLVSSIVCFSNVLIAAILIDMSVQFQLFNRFITQKYANILTEDYVPSIRQIVQRHLSLIGIMAEIEKACSMPLIIDVVLGLLIICFSGYYASVLPLFDLKATQSYFEITATTMSIYVVSYYGTKVTLEIETVSNGTKVTLEIETVSNTCYHINFIGTDLRFQKSLIIIMRRCQKPVVIIVGKFTALSIVVFVTVRGRS